MQLDNESWVVSGPAVVETVTPGPGLDAAGGQISGHTVNPTVGGPQSWDDRGDLAGSFVAPAALPLALADGDVFIPVIGQEIYVNQGEDTNDSGFYTAALTISRNDTLPSAGDIPAPWIRWSGAPQVLPAESVDVAAYAASLPTFAAANLDAPSISSLRQRVDRPVLAMATISTADREYGAGYPLHFASISGAKSNYGQTVHRSWSAAWLMAMLDTTPAADAEALLRRLIVAGYHFHDAIMGYSGGTPTTAFQANGGIAQHQVLPVLVYLHATGQLAELPAFMSAAPLNQWGNVVRWGAGVTAQLSPHDDPSWLIHTRRRQVTAVNGLDITFETFRDAVASQYDPPKMNFLGADIVRESDSGSALVTASDTTVGSGSNTFTVTVGAMPAPAFAPGDIITFAPAPGMTPVVGEVDYVLEGWASPHWFQPVTAPSYLAQQDWTADAIAAAIMGLDSGDLANTVDLVRLCNNGVKYAPMWGVWRDPNTDTPYDLAETFWQEHAASLGL